MQGIASQLRKALNGDFKSLINNTPPLIYARADGAIESELSKVVFIAAGAESRVYYSTDYRNTAERVRKDLKSAKWVLSEAINASLQEPLSNVRGDLERSKACYALARIQVALGEYEDAERFYDTFRPIIMSHDLDGWTEDRARLDSQMKDLPIEIMVSYLSHLVETGRNPEFAPELAMALSMKTTMTDDMVSKFQLSQARLCSNRGDYEGAARCLSGLVGFNSSVLSKVETSIEISMVEGITNAGLGQQDDSIHDFNIALVKSAVLFGLWYPTTTKILYNYGKALKSWGRFIEASHMLYESCLGHYHRFGPSHPASRRAYTELEMCKGSQPLLESLRRFVDSSQGDGYRLSVAYEHIYLNTVIDLLVHQAGSVIAEAEVTLQDLLDEGALLKVETSEHPAIYIVRIHRTLARAKFEQGNIREAITLIEGLTKSVKRSAEGELQSNLDLAMFYARNMGRKNKATEISRRVFFDVDAKLNHDQARAFHRKLAQLHLTHFTVESIAGNPLPIKVLENVGTGAYAVVESVELGTRLYARKSIALPRYNQNRIRDTIKNEISVIEALAHPHIVQIYCTYEEKARFAIILEPLANYDLEAFLEQHISPVETVTEHVKLIWKWLRCLANTLVFIHSKGIRHKDIKTRNILIKDTEVIFADFGSSHAFLDEGTSVTEGPAFGHTLMYCAPEVMSWDKRSRSADIFSLGCVFSEMATSLDGRSIADYYDFRSHKMDGQFGETHAYHATLDLVHTWFDMARPDVKNLFDEVIRPMLHKNPDDRPTASSTCDAIQACFKATRGESLAACSKCYPMHWEPERLALTGESS